MEFNPTGLKKCAHYAFPPNLYHFCGPDKQADLLGYLKESVTDKGLVEIINHFETLYPYLVLIATENNIKDPFDPRVVEAYWLGNSLLKKVKLRSLSRHFEEVQQIKKKLPKKAINQLFNKIDTGFPHHTYHVLNIFRRTGHIPIPQTLTTMDSCRISWGMVIKNYELRIMNGKENYNLLIKTRPIKLTKEKLMLGKPVVRQIKNIGKKIDTGDWVTVHWGYVCEKVTGQQIKVLNYYTRKAIAVYNQRLLL